MLIEELEQKELRSILEKIAQKIREARSILVLTGAGISADSGIPTFRGEEGMWVVGSKNYFPEELATYSSFMKMSEEIWKWYTYRQSVCAEAQVNEGHIALTELEKYCEKEGKEFLLVTQNVDNLHSRAGTQNIVEIHGNIFKMRCSSAQEHAYDIHDVSDNKICSRCGAIMRPHVLWFDEYYDDTLFQTNRVIDTASRADLLIVVGTTLQTTLPYRIVALHAQKRQPIIEINPVPILTNYTDLILTESSSSGLPKIFKKVVG